jgi:isoquinoline 1-oxidoreductase subunit beta
MPELSINGQRRSFDADPAMPLLWKLRDAMSVRGVVDLPFGSREAETDARLGSRRRFGDSPHAFAAGSFVDELAAAEGKDPLQFLLSLLGDRQSVDRLLLWDGASGEQHPINVDRLRNVLLLAAARSGWRSPLPERHGRGIAVHRSSQSYVAVVAHVSVAGDGMVSVPRIDMAVDCGKVVDPARVAAAFEDAAARSLGNALSGGVTAKNRRAQAPRIDAAPDTHVYVVRSEEPSGAVGEPGMPPVAVAITNGIFAATSQRVRALPVDPRLLKVA